MLALRSRALRQVDEQPARVLVVDDCEDNCEVVAGLLASLHVEVRVARDGASAVEAAMAFRPDVVLLDIGLPDTDGIDVARLLQSRPQTALATIVVFTAFSDAATRARVAAAGISHYLTKPLDLDRLCPLVTELVSRTEVLRAARTL